MATTSIQLLETAAPEPSRILQLYEHLELFSLGEPPTHTLFILGRAPLSVANAIPDQLLLVDPPLDAKQRFQLPANTAVLFTGSAQAIDLPLVETIPGGVAHLRIGPHFVDVYSQRNSTLIYLPAVGILCGGCFASDVGLPVLVAGSDGSEELETLRLLARLVKASRLQFYLPQVGSYSQDKFVVINRLAADVAYLHNLRRVLPALAQRSDDLATAHSLAASLLPVDRQTPLAQRINSRNVEILRLMI